MISALQTAEPGHPEDFGKDPISRTVFVTVNSSKPVWALLFFNQHARPLLTPGPGLEIYRWTKTSTNYKIILALFMVPFCGGLSIPRSSPPWLPALAEKHSLSLIQVGFMTALMRFLAFVVQPSVGYLADRYQTRIFVLGRPVALSAVYFPSWEWPAVSPFCWSSSAWVPSARPCSTRPRPA